MSAPIQINGPYRVPAVRRAIAWIARAAGWIAVCAAGGLAAGLIAGLATRVDAATATATYAHQVRR